MQRVLIFLHGASNGWVHDNNVTWHCGGWLDGDTSDSMVIEDNRVTCTNTGDNRSGSHSHVAGNVSPHPVATAIGYRMGDG